MDAYDPRCGNDDIAAVDGVIWRRPGRCSREAVIAVRTRRRHVIGVESDEWNRTASGDGGEPGVAATIGTVAALVADDFAPEDPVATTVAVSVCPTSLETGTYVAAVAPDIVALFPAH